MVRGIPPGTRVSDAYRFVGSQRRRPGARCSPASPAKVWGRTSVKKPVPKIQVEHKAVGDLPVDVFDEAREVVVLVEAPGLERDHATVKLEGSPSPPVLMILILVIEDSPAYGSGELHVELPCKVKRRPAPKLTLNNGIARIALGKLNGHRASPPRS